MSLYPGGRKAKNNTFVDALDDSALASSMALAMENAMKQYHQSIKNEPLPSQGERDRRLLFVSIARGVLGYLKDHQNVIATSLQNGSVNLNVDMDKP